MDTHKIIHSKEKSGKLEEEKEELEEEKELITYTPYTNWFCCTTYKDRSKFQNILQHIKLNDIQKQIIRSRYLNILENLQKRVRNHTIIYFIGHFIITVGSLFVPALLSIQNADKDITFSGIDFNIKIYWATFIISLLVTIWNGILTLFKIDKKYYFLNTILERLRSEGWQYFGLTGRYSGHLTGNIKPTHENQFIFFTHYIEKIKMKQVEEEYYKTDEKTPHTPNTMNQTGTVINTQSELYPPSPDKPITSLIQNIPEPIKNTIESIIKSQNIIETNIGKEQNILKEESNMNNEIIIPISSEIEYTNSDNKLLEHKEVNKILDTSKINKIDMPKSMKLLRNILHKDIELPKGSVVVSGLEMDKKENK